MVCGSTKAHLSSSGSASFGKLCCKKCPWSLYCSWPNLNSRAPKPAAGCCWMLLDAAGCLKPSRKHHKSEHSQDVGNISDHNFECFMPHYWSCCANLLPTIRKGFRTKTRNKQPIKANITGGIASASFANHSYITHQSDWSHMKHRWSPYLCSCSSPSFSPCEPRWQKTTTAVAYRDVPRIWSQHVSYKIGIGKSTAGSILVDLCCYYHNIS